MPEVRGAPQRAGPYSRAMGQTGLETYSRTFGPSPRESSDGEWRGLDAAELADRIAQVDDVPENESFEYRIVAPSDEPGPYDKAIVLLHGLNERRWNRYLPWAAALVGRLRRPVVLFPIAFHMQRAPDVWSDPHAMYGVSNLRRRQLVGATSFANAALSTRLQAQPERFYWSGFRTIADLYRLGDRIGASEEPLLRPDARLDLFGYSIGAFLSVILLASARRGPWSDARLFSFCGGCTLADCNPVSKEILDAAGARALRECFDQGLAQTLASHPDLSRSFEEDSVGRSFHAMLHPARCVEQRHERLAPLSERMAAFALVADRVMPPPAIEHTFREAGARFESVELPFPCGHTLPFGSHLGEPASVRAFESVFDRAAQWLD